MQHTLDPHSHHPRLAHQEAFNQISPSADGLGRGALAVRAIIAAGVIGLAVAAQITSREFDGGWFAAAIALCGIVFGVLALSLSALRPLGARMAAASRENARRRATARADERFLARAQQDPRLMAELDAALLRSQSSRAA